LSRAAEKGNERIVELLLQYGAQPSLGDKDRQTPLSRAGNKRIVELLLKNGAQPDLKDNDGQTPLTRAFHAGMLRLLSSRQRKEK
jgi:ankyrin repeat protein